MVPKEQDGVAGGQAGVDREQRRAVHRARSGRCARPIVVGLVRSAAIGGICASCALYPILEVFEAPARIGAARELGRAQHESRQG